MAIELRHSQDRLDGLQEALELYADAATQVVERRRAAIGATACSTPAGTKWLFGAVKHGGRNFIQVAKSHLRDWSKQELDMASYISSNANRFYTALEDTFGQVGAIGTANRIPALKLTVQQQLERADRKDKTGSRTFAGMPAGGRRRTNFELQTYLTSWQKDAGGPGYGPLFQAALGGAPLTFNGGTVARPAPGPEGWHSVRRTV